MNHTYTNILIHVIFSTKNRENTIRPRIRKRLFEYLSGIARKEFGKAIGLGGTENHVHAVLSLRSNVSVSAAICKLKSISSGWLRKDMGKLHWKGWQTGYAVFSVSQSQLNTVLTYINNQADHHRTLTFDEEFSLFLKRHNIDLGNSKETSQSP